MAINAEQQKVIDSDSPRLLVMAGAGAGKTFVMIHRIIRLVESGVDPKSILVLTFTNNAAAEMRSRYRKLRSTGESPEFRTFHSFCYSLLSRSTEVRNKLGYSKVPEITDDYEMKMIEKSVRMQCNIKLTDKQINDPSSLNMSQKKQFEIYQKAIKRELSKQNKITFDILCYDVCDLFVSGDESILPFKEQYKNIFVDEFQDTDPKQLKFLDSFKDTNFFYCGDALQNIYGFRGCSNAVLKALSKCDSWERIKMYQNYRSTNQICEFANKLSKYADDSYRIEMNGQRDGDKVEVISGSCASYKHPVDEDHLEQLKSILTSKDDEFAILCRTNKEVYAVTDYLTKENIPFVTSTKQNPNLHILNSVLSDEYAINWLSCFLNSAQYAEYIRWSYQEEMTLARFLTLFHRVPQVGQHSEKIIAIRKYLNTEESLADKLNYAADSLEIVLEELYQAENEIDIVNYLIECSKKEESAKTYVGTIHSVKGLEYNHVIVMGVRDKMFQLDSEDNKNLYYVAVTRAKNFLTVFTA